MKAAPSSPMLSSRPSVASLAKRAAELRFAIVSGRISGAGKEAKTDELEKRLRENSTGARLAFGALVALCAVLASIAFVTTHVDLLLNSKIRVFGNIVEIPRDWGMSLGAVLLVFLQYEALSLNFRLRRQHELWRHALPPNGGPIARRLAWLSGGLISDLYLTGSRYIVLRALARVILTLGLCVLPLLTLTFQLAVAMPAHSELLSSTVRAAATASAILTIWAQMQGLLARSLTHEDAYGGAKTTSRSTGSSLLTWWRAAVWPRVAKSALPVVVVCTQVLAWHVFLWPGEAVQRATTALLPDAVVWGTDEDSDKVRWWFWWSEGFNSNTYASPSYVPDAASGSTLVPSTRRVGRNTDDAYFQAWGQSDFRLDEKTAISTQFLRAFLRDLLGDRFSPNLVIRDTDLTPLSADQKSILGGNGANGSARARFEDTLRLVPSLDLRHRDLRFASFESVWMPKVALPPPPQRAGMTFTQSRLQGSLLPDFGKPRCPTCKLLTGTLGHGVDISGATLFSSAFPSGIQGISARYSQWENVDIVGWVVGGDFRGARLTNTAWLLGDAPLNSTRRSVIIQSDFSGAQINRPQFHNTSIQESALDGVDIFYPLLLGRVGIIDSRMRFARFEFPIPTVLNDDGRGTLAMFNVVTDGASFVNVTKGTLFIADPSLLSDAPEPILRDGKGAMVFDPINGPSGFFILRVVYGRDDFQGKIISYRPSMRPRAANTTRPDYWIVRELAWFHCREQLHAMPQCLPAASETSKQAASRILDALCEANLPWSTSGALLISESYLRRVLGPDSKRCKHSSLSPVELLGNGTPFAETLAHP